MRATFGLMRQGCRRWPYTTALTLFLVAFAVPFCLQKRSDWDQVYVPAAIRMRDGGDIFRDGYTYPPAFAWLAQPFTYLSGPAARLPWYAINVAALAAILRLGWRLSGGGRLEGEVPAARKEHLVLWLGLGCGIYYALDAFTNQQTDLVIVALVLLGCSWLGRGHEAAGGASLGLAAGLKCTPLLFAAYLIWRGRLLASAVLVGVALLVNLIPDWTHPPHDGGRLHLWAVRHLAPMGEESYQPGRWHAGVAFNHSVAGVALRWLTAEQVWDGRAYRLEPRPIQPSARASKKLVLGGHAALLLTVLAAAGWRRRPPGDRLPAPPALEYSLVMLLMVLLSPMSSKPHFTTLLLPGFCLARAVVDRREVVPALLLGGAILAGLVSNQDLVGRRLYDFAVWHGSVFWNALLLLGGCCWVLARQTWGRDTPEVQAPGVERRAA